MKIVGTMNKKYEGKSVVIGSCGDRKHFGVIKESGEAVVDITCVMGPVEVGVFSLCLMASDGWYIESEDSVLVPYELLKNLLKTMLKGDHFPVGNNADRVKRILSWASELNKRTKTGAAKITTKENKSELTKTIG